MRINRRTLLALIVVAGALLLANAALLKQNFALRSRLAVQASHSGPIAAGKLLPALKGLDLRGRNVSMDYGQSGRRVALFIFGPGCSACEQTVAYWKTILKNADSSVFSFIGISVVSDKSLTQEFVNRHDVMGLPIVMVNDPACREAYGLGFIPQTLIVAPDGKVEKNWPGMLEPDKVRDIQAYLMEKSTSTSN